MIGLAPLQQMAAWLSASRRSVAPTAAPAALPCTATRNLLALLDCNGPMTTRELADAAALTTRQVWGLLKGPRELGQVLHDDGLWVLDTEFPGRDVLRAAALLRSRGWQLTPPLAACRRAPPCAP